MNLKAKNEEIKHLVADKNDLMISNYSVDGVHLSEAGYIIWQNYIKEFVND